MSAGTLNLTGNLKIEAGATYDVTLTIYTVYVGPGDPGNVLRVLTGHTARMQIRDTIASATIRQELLSSTSGTVPGTVAKLLIGTGTIRIFIPAAITATYSGWSSGVYDLEIERTSDLYTWRELSGAVELSPEITR